MKAFSFELSWVWILAKKSLYVLVRKAKINLVKFCLTEHSMVPVRCNGPMALVWIPAPAKFHPEVGGAYSTVPPLLVWSLMLSNIKPTQSLHGRLLGDSWEALGAAFTFLRTPIRSSFKGGGKFASLITITQKSRQEMRLTCMYKSSRHKDNFYQAHYHCHGLPVSRLRGARLFVSITFCFSVASNFKPAWSLILRKIEPMRDIAGRLPEKCDHYKKYLH